MLITPIADGFIAPEILPEEYVFGSGQLEGTMLNTEGDWRAYLGKYEDQRHGRLETSACATFHTLNPIEILLEEQFGIQDEDYSERYIATLSGTTKQGNSPHKVAETIRKHGLVYESVLPFDERIKTWDDFYKPISSKHKRLGKHWLRDWSFKHDWVITPNTRKEEKNELLTDALKYSPIGISVYAWAEQDGVYSKEGIDNHWTTLVYGDQHHWYVFDTYPPYIKVLDKNFDFGFAKRYSVERAPLRTNWALDILQRLFT